MISPAPSPLPAKFTPLCVAYGDPEGGAGELSCVPRARPAKSPKIHPKNQRFFGDPGKGDFESSPFKGETEGVFWVDFGSSPFKGELERVSEIEIVK